MLKVVKSEFKSETLRKMIKIFMLSSCMILLHANMGSVRIRNKFAAEGSTQNTDCDTLTELQYQNQSDEGQSQPPQDNCLIASITVILQIGVMLVNIIISILRCGL